MKKYLLLALLALAPVFADGTNAPASTNNVVVAVSTNAPAANPNVAVTPAKTPTPVTAADMRRLVFLGRLALSNNLDERGAYDTNGKTREAVLLDLLMFERKLQANAAELHALYNKVEEATGK